MPPLTSSAINKGKTLAPKAVARRRPAAAAAAAAPRPQQPQPAPESEQPAPAAQDTVAGASQSDARPAPPTQTTAQPRRDEATRQQPAAAPLATPPATQRPTRQPTPPPQPAHSLEPSPLSLSTTRPAAVPPPAPQPLPRSSPSPSQSQPQSTVPSQPSITSTPPNVSEPVCQPSPAPVASESQPRQSSVPQSPNQLAGQKRKRPTPPPVQPVAQSTDNQNEAPPQHEHSDTEAALINGIMRHQEQQRPAPVAQMLPPAPANPSKPRAKRQRKAAPAPSADQNGGDSQAEAGAPDDAAAEASAAKPKKPRAKRKPKSAARIVEDENGNVVETDEPAESGHPAPKPRKPRQKKQKPPSAEGEEGAEDEPIEDPENHEIDITKITMSDLTRDRGLGKVSERETKMATIDWDEVKRKRLAEAEAIRAGQNPATFNEQPTQEGEGGEGEENQETPRPPPVVSGPRLRLDADGNMIVDEESLRIDRQAQATRNAENLVATENDDLTRRVNQMSWINERRRDPTDRVPFFKMKSDPWSDEETDRFYEALRMFGTDFFIISKMFPPKTRRQIKLKFIREERLDPDRVNRALAGEAVPMDLESFAEATGQDLGNFKDPRELEEELRAEGEEQREEIAKKKKEIEEAKKQRDIQMAAREKDQEERAAQRREKAAMRANRRRGIFGTGTF